MKPAFHAGLLALAALLPLPARANLGDTARETANRFGDAFCKRVTSRGYSVAYYHQGDWNITQTYGKDGRCIDSEYWRRDKSPLRAGTAWAAFFDQTGLEPSDLVPTIAGPGHPAWASADGRFYLERYDYGFVITDAEGKRVNHDLFSGADSLPD